MSLVNYYWPYFAPEGGSQRQPLVHVRRWADQTALLYYWVWVIPSRIAALYYRPTVLMSITKVFG